MKFALIVLPFLLVFLGCGSSKEIMTNSEILKQILNNCVPSFKTIVTEKHRLELRFQNDSLKTWINIASSDLTVSNDSYCIKFKSNSTFACGISSTFSLKNDSDDGLGNSVTRCDTIYVVNCQTQACADSAFYYISKLMKKYQK